MVARTLIERMRTSLGQPLIMENVAGANGTIATARVVRAAPDGYTLILGTWNSQIGANAVYPVTYDTLTDLEPIALATISRLWLVGKAALPPNNITELIAWLKANPGKASAASVGQGSASHVCGIHFQNTTGTQFQFVFYRGGTPAYQDLVAGHIDLMCAERSATVEHLRAGKIKAYGLLAEKRWAVTSELRKRCAPITRQRSTGGGRSSGRRASSRNECDRFNEKRQVRGSIFAIGPERQKSMSAFMSAIGGRADILCST